MGYSQPLGYHVTCCQVLFALVWLICQKHRNAGSRSLISVLARVSPLLLQASLPLGAVEMLVVT